MRGHGTKLTQKKEKAIAALLLHRSVEEAARSVGIGERTLWRWLQEPGFNNEYLKARREAVRQANARIQQNCGAAAGVLLRLMADPSTPASVRVRAAQCILERGSQSLEEDDLDVRIAQLENAERARRND